jgi:putative PIN family toxin of toxin-antitoxin system
VRIFLDTNVLASALTTRGLCADLLQSVLAEHELIISVPVLEELDDILPRKFQLPAEIVKEFLELLKREGTLVTHAVSVQLNLRDADDERILANALAGSADVFVTGDRELLALKKVKGVPIVSPRGMWTILRK